MSLQVSHNAFNGSCTSFNDLRYWLAQQIGIDLNQYIGFRNKDAKLPLSDINHDLSALFNHSDCCGIILPVDCHRIANGIELALMNSSRKSIFYTLAKQFQNGCLDAYEKNQSLIFS